MATKAKEVLTWLEHHGTQKAIADQARYGITAPRAFGVSVGDLKKYARQVGVDHALTLELWASGWYEARLLAAFCADPTKVTPRLMDSWANDFDNWGVVDTVCFSLFDRAPQAWKMVPRWAAAGAEFKKRAAFALIWSLTVHDKAAPDKLFIDALQLIQDHAGDDRHFVKKAINMALRAVGKRNIALNRAAIATAEQLANLDEPGPQWIGKDALRELRSPSVLRRLHRRTAQ